MLGIALVVVLASAAYIQVLTAQQVWLGIALQVVLATSAYIQVLITPHKAWLVG